MLRFALALSALYACTYPEKEFAGPYSCLGAPPPTTAVQLVKVQGTTVDPFDFTPLAGVTLTLRTSTSTISAPVTTDGSGAFSFTLNTNGTPVDGVYIAAEATGRVSTFNAPARPITANLNVAVAVLSKMEAANLAMGSLGLGMMFTPGTGAVLMTVADCNGRPINGATLTTTPSGVVRYFDGIMPSMTATATDAGGVALVANLPPGQVMLTATGDGMTLRSRSFTVVADSFIQTIIEP